MIDLSIIIPHYNTPHYLKELLESIPALPNVQIIVVDDKSDKFPDDYLALKQSSGFKHVTFLDNTTEKKNAGTCRNIGLTHAEGKWLLFADADDLFVEGFYDITERYFSSSYDVIFFIPTSMDRDTKEVASRHLSHLEIMSAYIDNPMRKNELQLRYKLFMPWSKMIRREFVVKNDICFSEVIKANDAAFSIKAGYNMQSFAVSKDIIYCVINSAGTISTTISEEGYDAGLGEFVWMYTFLKKKLSKKDFKLLGLCAAENHVYKVLKYGFGFGKLFSVLKLLRKNKVRILAGKYLNPLYLFNRLINERKVYNNDKRFFVRK